MTETHNPKYNFKAHIVNLSHSDNFDNALKEWIQMPETYNKLHKGTCKCICQRIIKNFYYIYNKKTFKYINVGTGCYNKFNFTISNTEMPHFLKDIIIKYAKGEYENIDDLEDYSTNIKLRIEKELTDMYKRCDTDIIKLNTLKDDIIELIEGYNFTCLEDLKKLVIETINILEKRKQKIEEERIEKEKIEEEERKQIVEEERKLDEEEERKKQEYETEYSLVKSQFENGYYINITKTDTNKYKETILLDYIKKQYNTYIQRFINIYKDNIYLYDKLKNILDNKLNKINLIKKQTEEKKQQEQNLLKEKRNQELQKELEEINNINLKKIADTEAIQKDYILFENIFINKHNEIHNLLYEKQNLLAQINIIDANIEDINKLKEDTNLKKIILDKKITEINKICKEQSRITEIQIIDKNIILYNNTIEKWKLMTHKKELDESVEDYNKRIIYTKNGPLKIKDIILLSEIVIDIDKDINTKIRQIKYIEDTNDDYMDIGKPWILHDINYKEFINFDINTICDLNIKFYILNTKKLEYFKKNPKELEFYIRYKLSQKIFSDTDYHNQKHLRFNFDEDIDFDCQDNKYNESSNNKYIIELFNHFYNDKNVLIYTSKGTCFVRFININNQIIDTIEYTSGDKGTVNILMDIVKYEINKNPVIVKYPEFIPTLYNVKNLKFNGIDYYICKKTNNVFTINKDGDIGTFIGLYDKELKKIYCIK
jgi:hypothetical protein